MFCSTIITTIGRNTVNRAINSILSQDWPTEDFELIVVNDSGMPLNFSNWADTINIRILNTFQRERSVARNTGAAIARGRYLHFLDDDDWMASDFLLNMHQLSRLEDASWLYGVSQLVDRQDQPLIKLKHGLKGNCFLQTMAGEWIPLQASLIRASDFRIVGGFNPLLAGPEDIDLLRRISLVGSLAESSAMIAYIERGDEGSTTDYQSHAQASRWAREHILLLDGVLARLVRSARTSEDFGRVLRIYLTSAVWNFRSKRILIALERLWRASIAFLHGGLHIFTSKYWHSLFSAYASQTFARGWQERPLAEAQLGSDG